MVSFQTKDLKLFIYLFHITDMSAETRLFYVQVVVHIQIEWDMTTVTAIIHTFTLITCVD